MFIYLCLSNILIIWMHVKKKLQNKQIVSLISMVYYCVIVMMTKKKMQQMIIDNQDIKIGYK